MFGEQPHQMQRFVERLNRLSRLRACAPGPSASAAGLGGRCGHTALLSRLFLPNCALQTKIKTTKTPASSILKNLYTLKNSAFSDLYEK